MYPPLVDNIPEERPEEVDSDSVSANGSVATGTRSTGVSSVPFVTRRRLMSMQQPASSLAVPAVRRVGNADGPPATTATMVPSHSTAHPPAPALQSRKTSGSTMGEKLPMSMSPEQLVDIDEPPKASAFQEAGEDTEPVNVSRWGRRLDEIERSQAKIEGLLEQIAAKL